MRALPTLAFTLLLVTLGPTASAQSTPLSFSDVPPSHQAHDAVHYLAAQNVLKGYSDGTFRPDQRVTRAEAIKIIVSAVSSPDRTFTPNTTSLYTDVPVGVWYEPYVTAAQKELGIIDGPPKSTWFRGENNVTKAEFLKMFLLGKKIDPLAYDEIKLPLSSDVTDATAWYYPYLRFAITASMIMVQSDGTLNPAQELTRGQVALILHRYFMYNDGRRTQSLLSAAESDLINVLQMLDEKSIDQAGYASARALLAVRGANTKNPEAPLVQGAVKITQAFRSLVRGYIAGSMGNFDEAVTLSKEAWTLADQARSKSADLGALAEQVQVIASNMAETARSAGVQ